MSVDLRSKIVEGRGALEKFIAAIPGFKGYKERETRRDADKLLRNHLADQLDEQRRRARRLQEDLVSSGQVMLVDDLDRATNKLQTLRDRVKTASYGYAGFFDAVKVNETELDALYDFDNSLLGEVPNIATALDAVAAAIPKKEGVAEAISNLADAVEKMSTTWHRRESAITGAV
jgi:hypothetical protein